MRVCTIAWWPGKVPGGATTNAITSHMDWLPTFAAIGGGETPSDRKIDGLDLSALLLGDRMAFKPRETFFYYRGFTLEAVRSGPWKLHLAKKELYDLDSDPGEAENIAVTMTDQVTQLTALAETMKSDLGLDGKDAPGVRPLGRVENPKPLIAP
jgi:arylsulfatase A-like enzyme